MKMKKSLGLLAAVGLIASQSVMANTTVTVSGSTSVTNLMEVLAETYTQNTGVTVEVQGTGSSAGIRAANDGTSMIGMSSRDVKDSEMNDELVEIVMAKDGIAVAVNPANKVQTLTAEQVTAIYKGEIKNWAEVGGDASPIVVVSRDAASGTRGAFEEIMSLTRKINDKTVSNIAPQAQIAQGNGAVKTTVAHNPFAIGYISLGSVDETVAAVAVDGVEATDENIVAGEYKVARPFVLLVNKSVDPAATQYIDWILSEEGQEIVSTQDYIPVK